ncbi:bifunctional DNA primase/polymerase [Streptomyces microflavus]|uniref:bifunctional DNA primase/polymerase n=1 Tax=Streptomyces microflavus TaxID=1919 RepID=UPI00364EA040
MKYNKLNGSPSAGNQLPFADGAPVYAEAGWAGVIPAKGKVVQLQGVTGGSGRQTQPDEYLKWAETGPGGYYRQNIALRLSDALVGLDVDAYDGKPGAATLEALEAAQGVLPATFSSTSRGPGPSRIFFYRLPAGTGRLNTLPGPGIETIQHHHRYAVVWPSRHPGTGETYRWFGPDGERLEDGVVPSPEDFPELPAAWVAALSSEGVTALSGTVVPVLDGEPLDVRAMLTPGAITDGQDNKLAALAWHLYHSDLPRSTCVDILEGVVAAFADNAAAGKVPWKPGDGEAKWEYLEAKGEQRGSVVLAGSDDFDRLVAVQQQRMRVNAEAARRERAEVRPERPKMLTGAEFLAADFGGVMWRVDGLLAQGGNALLAAQAKAGKTTLRNNLIKSLVDGEPFLGRFEVAQDGVLAVFDLEMPDEMAQDWLRRLKIQHPERFMYVPMLGRGASLDPTDPDSVAEWAADLKAAGVTTMLIDCLSPLLAAFGLDEDKPSQVRPLLEGFNTLKRAASVQEIVLIHHMGHNGTRARGASSLLDWPDAIWDLTKDEQERRYLSARGRGVDVSKSALEFDPQTKALTLADAEPVAPELKQATGTTETKILAHFEKHPEPLTRNEVANAIPGRKATILAAVKALLASERLAEDAGKVGPVSDALFG